MKFNRLSDYRIKKNMVCFSEDLAASKIAKILDLNHNTVNAYYNLFRKKIVEHLENIQKKFSGEIELDKNYFGAKRIRGKKRKRSCW